MLSPGSTQRLAAERSEDGPLILVSNRGPVEHYIDDAGHIGRRAAGGGVAVALASAARSERLSWIAGACSFADHVVALTGRRIPLQAGGSLRLIDLPDEVQKPFYQGFCNPLLWFVQHTLAAHLGEDSVATAQQSWRDGYLPANRLFADAVIDQIDASGGFARVMLHDYHLYLAPRFIREARPHAALQQFVHIPWPRPEAWQALPAGLVRAICDGLLANDSLVFQTERDAGNFLATCHAYLQDEVAVAESSGEVEHWGHRTSVWFNPISVDIEELMTLSASPQVESYRRELAGLTTRRTIVRVDRLDPSKNALRGFQAFERLLERSPSLHGNVSFMAFLVPSRTGIPEYDAYSLAVFECVERVNRRFGGAGWTPIRVFHEQNRERALAGLQLYDVLLVNSLADGMNLVSKEGPALNRKDGVLVLSRRAGSFDELAAGALAVDPYDVEATASALQAALEMRRGERQERALRLQTAIERHQLSDWLRHQLTDLAVSCHLRAAQARA